MLEFLHSIGFDPKTWKVLKAQLIREVRPDLRRMFSKATYVAKGVPLLDHLNELEYELMRRWVALTGKSLIFTDDGQARQIDPQ